MDLSFQLLSSEVRLKVRLKSGAGSPVPPPGAPRFAPASFTMAGLVRGWGQGFRGEETAALDGNTCG